MFQIIDTTPASLKKLNDAITALQNMAYDQNGASLRANSVTPDKLSSDCIDGNFTDINVSHVATLAETHQQGRFMSYGNTGNVGFWIYGNAIFFGTGPTMINGSDTSLYIGSGGDININANDSTGTLKLEGKTIVLLNPTTIDALTTINADLVVNGNVTVNGTLTHTY